MSKVLNGIAVLAVLGCAIVLGRQWKSTYQSADDEPEVSVPLGANHIGYKPPVDGESAVEFSLMIETPEGEMITEAEYRRRHPEAFAKQNVASEPVVAPATQESTTADTTDK